MTCKDAVQSAYEKRAEEYIELLGSMDAMAAPDCEAITTWARGVNGPIVDAGCGPGHWSDHLSRIGVEVFGVDMVEAFIASAKNRFPHVRFEVGELDPLPVAPASVGGILAWYSLIHAEPEHVPRILAGFATALRPGGTVLIGFFTGPDRERFDHAVAPAWFWPVSDMARCVEEAGFIPELVETRHDEGKRPHAAMTARKKTDDASTT